MDRHEGASASLTMEEYRGEGDGRKGEKREREREREREKRRDPPWWLSLNGRREGEIVKIDGEKG